MRRFRVNLAMYAQAIGLLARHPSVFVMPLLAAVMDLLLSQISTYFTDPVGGFGAAIFQIVIQLVYGFCFGVAVIGANNVWRRQHAGFDAAWEEGRSKAGGIVVAAIGFYFLVFAAGYIASFLGGGLLQIVLELVAAFFLIYTIPAAAIGGMPGNLAIGASFRAVRESLLGTAVLAIVFVLLWIEVPAWAVSRLTMLAPVEYQLVYAGIKAIVLAYLAFPFAKQYDDIAFTGYYR